MRTRLALGVAAALLLVPHGASATCVMTPFDRVVRQADAVLVGTVADANVSGEYGIVVRLDVEEALKGSLDDGRHVVVTSCGPPITGAGVLRRMAKHMVGMRKLWLLSEHQGIFYEYGQVTTPQNLTIDEKIARARQVLAPLEPKPPTVGVGLHEGFSLPWWLWPLAAGAIMLVLGGAVILLRRAAHHRESRA